MDDRRTLKDILSHADEAMEYLEKELKRCEALANNANNHDHANK